jgi:O-antigen/teichoic acid export membrane protein
MSLGNSLRGGIKWLLAGNIGMRFLDFAFGVVLARLLVPADFGMIVTISVFTGVVGIISSGGMGQSLIRAKEADDNDFSAVFTMQLSLGVFIYLCFYLTAPLIADFFHDPLYTDLIRVSTIVFLMRPFALIRTAWLNRDMAFKHRSIVEVATTLLTGAASCLMAWGGMGVWALTLSGLVGALVKNALLARIVPLALRLNFDWARIRRHGGYGSKFTINDLLSHITAESKNLLISKLAGPAVLGLFNKAESLSRLPNEMFMSATLQPVFRAMSKLQDDIPQTRDMYYRVITLLMVYTTPFYIGLWWVAEPFIGFVYGEKWVAVAEPMIILVASGLFLNILYPCSVLLDAQNRLNREMVALVVRLFLTIVACLLGLNWGMAGVAWAVFFIHVFTAVYFFILVRQAVAATFAELLHAITPGVILNGMLFVFLGLIDQALSAWQHDMPALYLFAMVLAGMMFYVPAFLFLPMSQIKSESELWRTKLSGAYLWITDRRRA